MVDVILFGIRTIFFVYFFALPPLFPQIQNIFNFIYPLKLFVASLNFVFAMLFFITLMALIGIFFRDFKQILPSILQISFLTSPIMFPAEVLGKIANLVYLNPLYTIQISIIIKISFFIYFRYLLTLVFYILFYIYIGN